MSAGSGPSCFNSNTAPCYRRPGKIEDGTSAWAPATTWETQWNLLALDRPTLAVEAI